jgi:GLPGLI family protein
MKKSIALLLFIFLFSFLTKLNAQGYKVLYEVNAKLGKNRNSIKEDFLLIINRGKSAFVSRNKLISDSIFSKYYKKINNGNPYEIKMDANDSEMISMKKYKNKIPFVIEKDFKNKQLKYQDKGFMSIIQYTQKMPDLKWYIQDSTKNIFHFKVRKATLHYKGRDYTAWYSTDITIPDGPYKFWGLPGLIMEIYDTKKEYTFRLKGIEKSDFYPQKLFMEKSGLIPLVKTTEKNFLKDFYNTYNTNAILGTTAVIGQDRDEYAREKIEKLKGKRDNPIELK